MRLCKHSYDVTLCQVSFPTEFENISKVSKASKIYEIILNEGSGGKFAKFQFGL